MNLPVVEPFQIAGNWDPSRGITSRHSMLGTGHQPHPKVLVIRRDVQPMPYVILSRHRSIIRVRSIETRYQLVSQTFIVICSFDILSKPAIPTEPLKGTSSVFHRVPIPDNHLVPRVRPISERTSHNPKDVVAMRSVEPLVITVLSFKRSESVRVARKLIPLALACATRLDLLEILPTGLLDFSFISLLIHVEPDLLFFH